MSTLKDTGSVQGCHHRPPASLGLCKATALPQAHLPPGLLLAKLQELPWAIAPHTPASTVRAGHGGTPTTWGSCGQAPFRGSLRGGCSHLSFLPLEGPAADLCSRSTYCVLSRKGRQQCLTMSGGLQGELGHRGAHPQPAACPKVNPRPRSPGWSVCSGQRQCPSEGPSQVTLDWSLGPLPSRRREGWPRTGLQGRLPALLSKAGTPPWLAGVQGGSQAMGLETLLRDLGQLAATKSWGLGQPLLPPCSLGCPLQSGGDGD